MKKRIIAMILSIVMVIGMLPISVFAAETDNLRNFTKRNTYTNNTFDDVEKSDWFYENVKSVYELGLMQGKGENKFDTESSITIAETLTIAARLHSIYYTGTDTFEASNPWYQVYADYCAANGIASINSDSYSQIASRTEFVMILANALPAEVFGEINKVAVNAIPDVKINDTHGTAVYKMYRAGIMIGNDDIGTFSPSSEIRRSEVATIVTRMVDISLRKHIQLGDEYTVTFNMNGQGKQIDPQTVVEGYTAEKPADPTKATYVFKGWYTQKTGGQQFDFNTPITEDITLYARWEIDPLWLALMMGWMNNQNNNNDTQTYTVTFDANGSNVTNLPVTQIVEVGGFAIEPNNPDRRNFEFSGWYVDRECIIKYDFATPVASNITLYARWNFTDSGMYAIGNMLYDTNTQEILVDISTENACNMNVYILNEAQTDILYQNSNQLNGGLERETISHIVNKWNLPQYYVIIITITDDFGNDLCNHYTYINNTRAFEEFIEKTIYDFDSEDVINLDNAIDNNFIVVTNDVSVIKCNESIVVTYDEATGKYTFSGNIISLPTFETGKKYAIEINNDLHLITPNDISYTGNTIVIESDNDQVDEYLSYIKVDVSTFAVKNEDGEPINTYSSNPSISLMSIPDININVPAEQKLSQKLSWSNDNFELTGQFSATLTARLVIYYDIILFGKDYFKYEASMGVTADLSAKITAKAEDDPTADSVNDYIWLGEINFPFGITGLSAGGKLTIPFDWELSGNAELNGKITVNNTVKYNTIDGKQNSETKSFDPNFVLSGKIRLAIGLQIEFSCQFLYDVAKFSLPIFIGIETKATAEIFNAADALDSSKTSLHMCSLCADGEVYLKFTISAVLSYKITKHFKGTPINAELVNIKPHLGDYYVSIINSDDSIHNGNIVFDWGDCPNITWKTTFVAKNSSNTTTNDLINVHNNRSDSVSLVCSENSVFSEFLYNGSYIAKSTIDGTEYTQTFKVDDAPQTVTIKASNGGSSTEPDQPDDDDPIIPIPPVDTGYTVSGRLISATDGTPVVNMGVELHTNSNIHYDNINSYTATSDSNGYFSFSNVEAQTHYIFRTGDGTNFQYYQIDSVTVSQDTDLGTIQLIPVSKTATLLSGKEFNASVKFLTAGTTVNYSDKDNVIEYIEFTDTMPSGSLTSVDVSAPDSSVNITAYWNESNKTITVYSTADEVLLNPDSSYMFYNFTALKGIDLGIADSMQATNMISMFNSYSPLSTVKVGENFSFKGSVSNAAQYAVLPTLNEVSSSSILYGLCDDGTQFTGMWKINDESTLYNAADITEQDRGIQAVYVADSYLTAIFAYGFNNTIADLAGGKNQITSIITTNIQPSGDFENTIVSSSSRSADIVAYWNSEDKSIIFYSLAEKLYINHGKETFMNFSALEHIDMEKIYVNTNDVQRMFSGCTSLKTLDTANFNISNAVFMHEMFQNCSSLTSLDLSSFNTSKAETMYKMFSGCTSLVDLDLSSFDTSYVISMEQMFSFCDSLVNIDLSHFNFTNVCLMSSMFWGCDNLVTVKLGFIDNNSVELTYGNGHNFSCDGVKRMERLFSECSALQTVDFYRMNTTDFVSMHNLFNVCASLENIIWGDFKTTNVNSMDRMFYGCVSLEEVDLSHFETDNVTSMSEMFSACKSLLSLNFSSFNTENVVYMDEMFYNNESIESITFSEKFTTPNVISMFCMFYNCKMLESLDLSTFNTSSIVTMAGMFDECQSLKSLDIGHFETNNVTSMEAMFYGCSNLETLDIGNFNTRNADLRSMFIGCYKLTSVTVGSNFSFKGNGTNYAYLPIPDEHEVSSKFTGKWISSYDGNVYSPEEITENDFCVDTTYIAEEIDT